MVDSFFISIIIGIAGVGFLIGVYSMYLRYANSETSNLSTQQRSTPVFSQCVSLSIIRF